MKEDANKKLNKWLNSGFDLNIDYSKTEDSVSYNLMDISSGKVVMSGDTCPSGIHNPIRSK